MTSEKSRLSPGQSLTKRFPWVGEKKPSSQIRDWSLRITGLVSPELQFSLPEFRRLPQVEKIWDTICVTSWTHLDHRWRGVMLNTLLSQTELSPRARFVRFVAYSNRGHDTSLPLDYARDHVLLATEVDGESLTEIHGAPVRTVCEGKYFYKSLKWVREIELLEEDSLGYWERESAYHNNADPWLAQRLVPQPLPADEFARRLADGDFSEAFAIMDEQFKQLKGRDLSGANFQGAQIKACDLSGAILRRANCQGANFTLTKFVGADLSCADLSAGDCEGADFRGADLRGADFRETSLTVARFTKHNADVRGAKFRRQDIDKEGLGEEEQAFLLDPKQEAIVDPDERGKVEPGKSED